MTLRTRIALIRGINVTGNRILPMAELRSLCTELGFVDPVTYIQSGNVIFGSDDTAGSIENAIRDSIKDAFGYEVSVMVRDPAEFEEIIDRNPFRSRDPKFLHVTLLSGEADTERLASIRGVDFGNDEFSVHKDIIYVHCPDGYGRTKLNNNYFEAKLGTVATTRNWRTVNKLAEMARDR